jgi:hypothetical protein
MKVRVLTWLFLAGLALVSVSDVQLPRAKPRHHCDCGDICSKATPSEKCKLRDCNGMDVR